MTEKPKTHFYPVMIILMVGGFITFLAWSAFQAVGLGSKVTDRDYYSKGLKYNTTQVEKRAAEVLGWKLETRLSKSSLEFDLTGSNGKKVDRAAGTLYLAIPGTAENIHLQLHEVSPGHYQVKLNTDLKGSVQARLELERDGARLNRQFLLNF